MKSKIIKYFLLTGIICSLFTNPIYSNASNGNAYESVKASQTPLIDGLGDDNCWKLAKWADINYLWLGNRAEAKDFSGRYKIVWSKERLYFLIEIVDDVLSDTHPDPLVDYYKDDTLEIFLDEDNSGGDHKYNYNAIAYHIAMDYNAVDLNKSGAPTLYNDHLNMKRTKNADTYTWEIELKVFSDKYDETSASNQPETLTSGKVLGFGIAYCDNDGGEDRESFIGSFDIPGSDKNLAWQNADVFSPLKLISDKSITQRYYVGKPYYFVNDEKKQMDVSPMLKDGRTFIPIRYVTESIGAQINWNAKDQKISIKLGEKELELWVGKSTARINDETNFIDPDNKNIYSLIVNGRVFLPLRFVSEALGLNVDWNATSKEIVVY